MSFTFTDWMVLIGTVAAVVCAITGTIAVWDRLRFDWAPRIFLGALIVTIIATGILDFSTRRDLEAIKTEPISRERSAQSVTNEGWPAITRQEISDLADDLRAYQPDSTGIIYDDDQEKPLALALAKAMRLANWKSVDMVGQVGNPRLGIEIFVGSEVTGALEPLKMFCRKQLKTEPTVLTTPPIGVNPKSIQITIGHNEAD
jgi:hypothetical protein